MTAQNLIDAALRTLGVLASGESPSSEESNDGLVALNGLIESWSAQALPIYENTRETVTMTGGSPYTLGTRPQKINGAQYTYGGVETRFEVVTAEQWSDPHRINVLYWDGGLSTSKFYVRPDPSAGSLVLDELRALSTLASLATSTSLPDGYERALRFNLALDLAGEYGAPITQELIGLANDSKTAIQGLNQNVLGTPVPAEA